MKTIQSRGHYFNYKTIYIHEKESHSCIPFTTVLMIKTLMCIAKLTEN